MKNKIVLALLVLLAPAIHVQAQETNPLPNVVVWGDDAYGQTDVPVDLTNAVSIACDSDFCLAVRSDGTVSGWGFDGRGQCDIPPDFTNAVAVAAGDTFAIALRADGTVAIWGSSHRYNIPMPTNFITSLADVIGISACEDDDPSYEYQIVALRADGTVTGSSITNVVAVAAGDEFYMALQSNGRVSVWGYDTYGETNLPNQLRLGLWPCTAIAAGDTHCLALRTNGLVVAWGDNSSGQTNVPPGLSNVVAIAAGSGFSMALQTNGNVVTWGAISTPRNMPVATAIAAGGGNAMAIVISNHFNPPPLPPPPTIFAQPISETVGFGSSPILLVGATGNGPFSYQWYFNGTNAIPGATNRFLVLTNFEGPQIGSYTVAVSNAGGSVTSQTASLNGLPPSLNISLIPAILITGGIGLNYEIQCIPVFGPTNTPWTTLATVTLTNNQQYYFDESAVGQPQRFYRAQQSP